MVLLTEEQASALIDLLEGGNLNECQARALRSIEMQLLGPLHIVEDPECPPKQKSNNP